MLTCSVSILSSQFEDGHILNRLGSNLLRNVALFLLSNSHSLLSLSCMCLSTASWYSLTVCHLMFSQLVPLPATCPSPTYLSAYFLLLNFRSLESGSHIIFWIFLRIIITENSICFLILSSGPRIIFISSGKRYYVHYVFSLNIPNDFSRKAKEMQNFPWELDGIIQRSQWHSFKRLK